MARIFVTGSADGLGRAAAQALLEAGHEVVVHVRGPGRLEAVRALVDRGAAVVQGDLAERGQVRELAAQVNALGSMDAVIHNVGVWSGPTVLAVNIFAPYLLTALMHRPQRLIYLSSGMHRGGRSDIEHQNWEEGGYAGAYEDSKLFVTTLAMALAERWPGVLCNAVDPGWVPTRMGGPEAPDDLSQGHLTQAWLASSDEPEARTTGGYWYHQRRDDAHPAARDARFQARLLEKLARTTGVFLE